MKKSICFIILLYVINPARADQIYQFCNNCYNTSDVEYAAEIFSQALASGDHSIIIINDQTNKLWDVRVRVTNSYNGNFFPSIGDNVVEIILTEFLSGISQSYAALKRAVDDPIVVDTRRIPEPAGGLIESTCPRANNGFCVELNKYLFNLDKLVTFRAHMTSGGAIIRRAWRKKPDRKDLPIIVIFSDGSIGAYEYNGGIKVSVDIAPVGATATDRNGEIGGLGGYVGLDDDINAPGNSLVPNGGASGDCTISIRPAIRNGESVYRISVTCE